MMLYGLFGLGHEPSPGPPDTENGTRPLFRQRPSRRAALASKMTVTHCFARACPVIVQGLPGR
jgi:hypothetical protein